MTLDQLNTSDVHEAQREFARCCGSTEWAARMTAARPFASADSMLVTADVIWSALKESDWREAFAAHPKIGDVRLKAERWAVQEQAGTAVASTEVLDRLAAKNREYETRFGYIFIVCATGKAADEMLTMLEQRLANDAAAEIREAAEEQRKITQLRLRKLLMEPDRR